MRLQRLLDKMQWQAEAARREQREREREKAAHPTVTPEMIADQKIRQISNLRKQTAEAKFQLQLDKQLEAESKKNLEATTKLRESRLTPAERKARAEETSRGRKLFSRIIPELAETWREEATLFFKNRKL
jgi:hypothetical protein